MDITELVFMTYNISHARKNWPLPNSIIKSKGGIRKNLDKFASLFKYHKVDIAGLQEVESKALFYDINHVDYLAEKAGFNHYEYGIHTNGINILKRIKPSLNYAAGTAILSKLPILKSFSCTFENGKKFTKGYVATAMSWPGKADFKFYAVSLHLDFSSKTNRASQAAEIIDIFKKKRLPVIIMGDFNCRWNIKNSPLRILTSELNLTAFEPAKLIITLPTRVKRADWILVSEEFEFLSYRVIRNLRISDHRPVVAKIGIKK